MKTLTRYILTTFGGTIAKREEIEKTCTKFNADPEKTINFMISYGYFLRILRGTYYVKNLEEFKFKKSANTNEILALAMEKLNINWYFGLYTSLRLNGLTHEYYDTSFILNDTLFRPKEIKVNGEKVKFIKLKSKLLGFGIVKQNHIRFSDIEKTLLDFIYLSKYRSVPEQRIISIISDYNTNINTRKTKEYLKSYPKTVEMVAKNAKLI